MESATWQVTKTHAVSIHSGAEEIIQMNSNSVNLWINQLKIYAIISAVLPQLLYNSRHRCSAICGNIYFPYTTVVQRSFCLFLASLEEFLVLRLLINGLFDHALVSQIIHIHLNLLIHEMHGLNNADTTIIHFLYSKNLSCVILMLTPKPTFHF